MAQAKKDDLVILERPKPLDGPHCENCPYFVASTVAPEAVQRFGADLGRGACHVHPVIEKKTPDDLCSHHPELQAKLLRTAFEPLIDRLAAVLMGRGK